MKKFLLMCFSFGFAISLMAQDRVVTGKLTSKDDASVLPGVNIVLKGTTTGTVSDAEGNFNSLYLLLAERLCSHLLGIQPKKL